MVKFVCKFVKKLNIGVVAVVYQSWSITVISWLVVVVYQSWSIRVTSGLVVVVYQNWYTKTFLSSTIFPFSSFPLLVGSVGLGSSD